MLRISLLAVAVALLAAGPCDAEQGKETTMHFPSGVGSLSLFMRHQAPAAPAHGPPILILHGATFPSASAAAWKIGGRSWMDELSSAGYDVYALDFLGYGGSDRYPEMGSDDPAGPPLGNVQAMVEQVSRAVEEILRVSGDAQVSLIAHSAGTFVAGRYAELHPERVKRLVLFGAPAPDAGVHASEQPSVRHFQMSAAAELEGFEPRVRESGRLDMSMFRQWADAYLATDSSAGRREPPSVRVPAGMQAAFADMNRLQRLPYDPARITMPVLVVQGEWDRVAPPERGLWLFQQLASPVKRFVVLSQGGHRVHLEGSRFQLYRETEAFLTGDDESDRAVHAVFFEVRPAGKEGRRAYLDYAARLAPRLQALPGFIDIERFENLTRPGWVLSVSRWRDEAALIGWRENVEHRAAQEKGRHGIFEDYRIRVARQVAAGGDLFLAEAPGPAGAKTVQNFESLRVKGHQVWLIEGDATVAGTHWQVIRDYGMHDRRHAPRG